jgi:hypothetical protein
MPLLLQITECKIGNDKATFFLHDRWLLPEPLATSFPVLYSHHTQQHSSFFFANKTLALKETTNNTKHPKKNENYNEILENPFIFNLQTVSVHEVPHNGIEWGLRNRLSNAADAQLALFLPLLQVIIPSDQPDQRTLLHGEKFSTKGAYKLLQQDLQDTHAEHIWTSRVPNKVKVFGWLLNSPRQAKHPSQPVSQEHHQRCSLPKMLSSLRGHAPSLLPMSKA